MKKFVVIAKWTLSVDGKIRLLGDKFEVDEATLATLNPELIKIVEEVQANEDVPKGDKTVAEVLEKPKRSRKKTVQGGNNDTTTTTNE